MTDQFDLERFVTAQEPVFDTVINELRAGRKRTHWIWFVFPQLRGLGRSSMGEHYGISSLAEARLSGASGCGGRGSISAPEWYLRSRLRRSKPFWARLTT